MQPIYIVFSATPYKMGRFIRAILHHSYNHISLAFDAELSEMYSFARFHENTPLYGGFVKESLRRHFHGERTSRIKVCRLEIPAENYRALREFISDMENSPRPYLYNTYSAIFTPLHIRLPIRKCFTCAEFVGDALSIAGTALPRGKFHSLKHTERLLAPHVIYEGSCDRYAPLPEWGEDHFSEHLSRFGAATATTCALGRLTGRAAMTMLAAIMMHLS